MSTRTIESWLDEALADCAGEPVLLLGDCPGGPYPPRVIQVPGPSALPAPRPQGRPFRLAVAVGVLERLPRDEASALLAALRDMQASRVLVAVPARGDPGRDASTWSREDMLAHGLDALGEATHEARELAVYGFDIDGYKRTPDWLNARNWANPENWGRYRW